jgi:hypothetical protein
MTEQRYGPGMYPGDPTYESLKETMPTREINVRRCARCAQDHEALVFTLLANPSEEWTHWATCPINREPIMLAIT